VNRDTAGLSVLSIREVCADDAKLTAVCHEQKRKLLVLYGRWETACRRRRALCRLRCPPTGAGTSL
jgi:hypothetical protein